MTQKAKKEFKDKKKDLDTKPVLEKGKLTADIAPNTVTEDVEMFRLGRQEGGGFVDIQALKDEKGDYPVLRFIFKEDGKERTMILKRDDLSAVTFAVSRQDQQHKLLNARFRKYREKKVRLAIMANKDIKKGEMMIVFRKERVPIDFEYDGV